MTVIFPHAHLDAIALPARRAFVQSVENNQVYQRADEVRVFSG
jgi:hypothetical protein